MTDKKAEWVVVPSTATVEMVGAAVEAGARFGFGHHYEKAISAAPRYTPQADAVEAALDGYFNDGSYRDPSWDKLVRDTSRDRMRAALAAAYPELVAEVERLKEADKAKLELAKSRADHEAKSAAHHSGSWHPAYEYHLTRHTAMCDMIKAVFGAEVERLRKEAK